MSFLRGRFVRRSCPDQMFLASAANSRPSEVPRRLQGHQPVALLPLLHQSSGRAGIPQSARSPVEMYRPGQRTTRRNLPDLRAPSTAADDAISDQRQILKLLNSQEATESELTMCFTTSTGTTRSGCAEPGSRVRVIGRFGRSEMYFAAVSHGRSHRGPASRRPWTPSIAFLSHAWAVTVTGGRNCGRCGFFETTRRALLRACVWRRRGHGAFQRCDMNTGGYPSEHPCIRTASPRVRARSRTLLFRFRSPPKKNRDRAQASAMLAAIREAWQAECGRLRAADRQGRERHVDFPAPPPSPSPREFLVHTLANYFRPDRRPLTTCPRALGVEEVFDGSHRIWSCCRLGPGMPV